MDESTTLKNSEGPGVDRFIRRLALIAALSILVTIAAAGYGIFRVYRGHVIRDAEAAAISLSEILVAQNEDLLIAPGPDGQPRLSIAPAHLGLVEHNLRLQLTPFQIVKVKIYDRKGEILFSTEPGLVGEIDDDNSRLLNALGGRPDSHLEQKDRVRDLADERKLDVDVVETYVPIRVGERVIGVFEIYRDVTKYRQEIHSAVGNSILLLTAIVGLVVGVALFFVVRASKKLDTAQRQLRRMATTDALTGVMNRGTILARAREEISRIDRRREEDSDYGLGFILLDIDHFKMINDRFGHLTGDQVLCEICERIRSILRSYDLLGRFGGEEFLIVLPDASLTGALATAERIRQAIRSKPFVFQEPLFDVTASFGVAIAREQEHDLSRILQRADEGLYLAKERGRDGVATMERRSSS
jgi:diguanylate cyclase (GGDEF)-like protein